MSGPHGGWEHGLQYILDRAALVTDGITSVSGWLLANPYESGIRYPPPPQTRNFIGAAWVMAAFIPTHERTKKFLGPALRVGPILGCQTAR